ncbi:MAG: sigma-54-dependent Fis family transcriptional regulator [Candidatus Manganitrophaceae bacterium]|nr:MAG: sigma-54-dependent Fis family transcriptional regulator [Candidatus Manganitrophaceae bacterium]
MKKILVIDDERSVQESIRNILKKEYVLLFASNGAEGLQRFREVSPDLILLDLIMPEMDGMTALKRLREIDAKIPIIMLTATRMIKTAVEAIKAGADDYLTKPFDLEELTWLLAKTLSNREMEKEVQALRTEISKRYGYENIIGNSRPMQELFEKIKHVADTKSTVLILGESGTGKELVAKALHYNSGRKNAPFIAINCAAIPETLLETELFGHERGAFTDAQSRRIGRFEQAHRGTLFLDEVAELSPPCQAKILRALEERKFMRIGGSELIESDVRVIAATNKDLEEEIRKGRFREDLYYRINVIPIVLQPLRKRREDIPLLVKHFLDKKIREEHLPPKSITSEAMEVLCQYDWPGNAREMENLVAQMVTLSSGDRLEVKDIPSTLRKRSNQADPYQTFLLGELALEEAVARLERQMISEALRKSRHVQTRAAQMLGISRRQLKYKMDALGFTDPRHGSKEDEEE